MATPARRTRSQSAQMGMNTSGLAAHSSSAYGGHSRPDAPDNIDPNEGAAGFASGMRKAVAKAAKPTPTRQSARKQSARAASGREESVPSGSARSESAREESVRGGSAQPPAGRRQSVRPVSARPSPIQEEAEPAAPPAEEPEVVAAPPAAEPEVAAVPNAADIPQLAAPDARAPGIPIIINGEVKKTHQPLVLRLLWQFFCMAMVLMTAIALNNFFASLYHPELQSSTEPFAEAPAYEAMFTRLYHDLYHSLGAKLTKPPVVAAEPAAMPDKLNLDIQDHNLLGLHYRDHFADARGGIIHPLITSPTKQVSKEQLVIRAEARKTWSWYNPFKWTGVPSFLQHSSIRGPTSVLGPWHESGECWCAEQVRNPRHINLPKYRRDQAQLYNQGGIVDPKGLSLPGAPRAQFGVQMPSPIYPTHAIIEHVPAQGTTDIASAPEWIEFFAYVEDKKAADRVWRAYAEATGVDPADRPDPEYTVRQLHVYGDLVTENSVGLFEGWWNLFQGSTKISSQMIPSGPTPLDHRWIKVARYRYDVHAKEHVQSVRMPVDFQKLGVPVQQMAVRVRSNYGAEDYTCMYRVRMLGEECAK